MRRLKALFAFCLFLPAVTSAIADYDNSQTVGPAKGWLVIDGGGSPQELRRRFVALAGGTNAKFVYIPTALSDAQIGDPEKLGTSFVRQFGVTQVTVLHTRDRTRANSAEFVEPLRHASGVWIDGGRQWRLADAYLGTAVELEIKALLARGGVVGGSAAGATIQGSYLVRGAPGTSANPDGDNRIVMAPGYEIGFGLLTNSAIDQLVNVRGREGDLAPVVSLHPNLLGIGIDQGAAIVVHGDLFKVIGGRVTIYDGKQHDGLSYYFLSPEQTFNLKTRAVEAERAADSVSAPTLEVNATNYPLLVRGDNAQANGNATMLSGQVLDTQTKAKQNFQWSCDYRIGITQGKSLFPAKQVAPGIFKLIIRMGNNQQTEVECKEAAGSIQHIPTSANANGGSSQASKYPLTLTVTIANRNTNRWGTTTSGAGLLASNDDPNKAAQRINIDCDTGLYSQGRYPARVNKPHQLKVEAREIGSDKVHESTCKY
jgi:cyanophycinase